MKSLIHPVYISDTHSSGRQTGHGLHTFWLLKGPWNFYSQVSTIITIPASGIVSCCFACQLYWHGFSLTFSHLLISHGLYTMQLLLHPYIEHYCVSLCVPFMCRADGGRILHTFCTCPTHWSVLITYSGCLFTLPVKIKFEKWIMSNSLLVILCYRHIKAFSNSPSAIQIREDIKKYVLLPEAAVWIHHESANDYDQHNHGETSCPL